MSVKQLENQKIKNLKKLSHYETKIASLFIGMTLITITAIVIPLITRSVFNTNINNYNIIMPIIILFFLAAFIYIVKKMQNNRKSFEIDTLNKINNIDNKINLLIKKTNYNNHQKI